MKFYSIDTPDLIIWDKEKDKRLCAFKNTELETEDNYIIDKLMKLDFMHKGERPKPKEKPKEVDIKDLSVKDLKALAKKNGLENYSNLNKEELIKLIEGD